VTGRQDKTRLLKQGRWGKR